MAVSKSPTKTASRASAPAPRFASLDPDMMVARGLPDGFIGTVVKSRWTKFNYPNSNASPAFVLGWWIEPDEGFGFEPFMQPYTAGKTEFIDRNGNAVKAESVFCPVLEDGVTFADFSSEDPDRWEGVFVAPLTALEDDPGHRSGRYIFQQIGKSTNTAFCMSQLIAHGFPRELIQSGDSRVFESCRFRFDRMLPPGREKMLADNASALGDDSGRTRDGKVLVPTEIVSMPGAMGAVSKTGTAAARKAAPTAAPSPAPTPTSSAASKAATAAAGTKASPAAVAVTDDRLTELVIEAIVNEGGGSVEKKTVFAYVLGHFQGAAMKVALDRLKDDSYQTEAAGFIYDADTQTFSLE